MLHKRSVKMGNNKKEIKKSIVCLLENYSNLKKKYVLGIEVSVSEKELINLLEKHLQMLSELEHEVLRLSYIDNDEGIFDYVIQHKLQLSERTFYRIKDNALMKLYEILPSSFFEVS